LLLLCWIVADFLSPRLIVPLFCHCLFLLLIDCCHCCFFVTVAFLACHRLIIATFVAVPIAFFDCHRLIVAVSFVAAG